MPDDYLRSIEPLIAIVLGCMRWKAHRLMKCDCEKRMIERHSPPCGRNAYDVGMPGARSSHELFIPSLPLAELSKLGLISHMGWNDYRHFIADSFSNCGLRL